MKNAVGRDADGTELAYTLTTSAIARATGISETMVRRLATREGIRFVLDSNGCRLFSQQAIEDVKKYLLNHPYRRRGGGGIGPRPRVRIVRSWPA
jgi:hypothetical protein